VSRVSILGKSGSGKSWYSGKKLADILEPEDEDEEFEYAAHLDLEDEERGLSLTDDPLLKTAEITKEDLRRQVVVDPDDPPSYIPEDELKDGPVIYLPKWILYKNKYVRFVPDGLNDEEVVVLCEMVADAALLTGDIHFSMDEAHRVVTNGKIGERVKDVVTGGRKRGVEWLFITQRPQAIHKQVLSQSTIGIFFKLTGERDCIKADKLAESFDAEDVLPSLPQREAIIEEYSDGTAFKIQTEEMERKYPHVAGDDGKADDKWVAEGEELDSVGLEDN